MSESGAVHPIFDDQEFWYKLDVDYEEAETLLTTAQEDDEGEEPEIQHIGEALLHLFEQRKGRAIEAQFGSVESFREAVYEGSLTDAKEALTRVYVEYIWIQNDEGEVFESEDSTLAELETIADDDRLVRERVNEEFDILWPGNATIDWEIDEGEVAARRYYQTSPIILRKSEESFEIRGRKKDRNRVVKRFRGEDDLEEQEPDRVAESIVDKIQDLLAADNDDFRITGVDFSESELPEKSRLRLKNDRAVYRDIEELRERDLVSMAGISEVNKLYLRDLRLGGKFRISVVQRVDGIEFELEASHKTDWHREQFKEAFTDVTRIEFNTIYEYGSEDQRYLFNRILAENETAYDSYYEELDSELQAVL